MPPLTVTSPQAAALLATPDVARLLKPFMRGPRTVGQAARELDVPLGALHYRVRILCRAGLLRQVGEVPRRGRSSPLYGAVASDFVFAADLLPPGLREALGAGDSWVAEIREQLRRALPPRRAAVVRVHLNAEGRLIWSEEAGGATELPGDGPGDGPAEPTTLQMHSAALYLSPDDAEALVAELTELYGRYHLKQGSRRYGLMLALTPLKRPVD